MTHPVDGATRPASPSSDDTVAAPARRRGRRPRDRGDADPDTRRLLIRTGLIALTEKG